MNLNLNTLLKLFPLPLPTLPEVKHHYVGRLDGRNRPVDSVSFAKAISLDNAFGLTVKYPAVDGTRTTGEMPAMTIESTYHVLDNKHIPERIKVDEADVNDDIVHEHTGFDWIGFSFEWRDTNDRPHRADVRAYVDLDILHGLL